MDGLELSALNDFSDAHRKLLSSSLGRKPMLLAEATELGSLDCIPDLPALKHPTRTGQRGSDFTASDADI